MNGQVYTGLPPVEAFVSPEQASEALGLVDVLGWPEETLTTSIAPSGEARLVSGTFDQAARISPGGRSTLGL